MGLSAASIATSEGSLRSLPAPGVSRRAPGAIAKLTRPDQPCRDRISAVRRGSQAGEDAYESGELATVGTDWPETTVDR